MKHLRKDDGYVLVYVLIVFTILSLVAVSICGMALRNLQAQKADAARMEARYAAEGVLQQFVAQVEELETFSEALPEEEDATETTMQNEAKKSAKTAFWASILSYEDGDEAVSVDPFEPGSPTSKITVTARAKQAGYTATIRTTVEITVSTVFDENTKRGVCSFAQWKYTSYDISYEAADPAEEGGAG